MGECKSKWIKVQYDHMSKYCKECCLQGHDYYNCQTLHPELYDTKKEGEDKEEGETADKNPKSKEVKDDKSKLDTKQNMQEWLVRSKNKYKRDKYEYIIGEVDIQDENPYNALREEERAKGTLEKQERPMSTKEWVNNSFCKQLEQVEQTNTTQQGEGKVI